MWVYVGTAFDHARDRERAREGGEIERGRENTRTDAQNRTEQRTGPARVNGLFRDGRKREERREGGV